MGGFQPTACTAPERLDEGARAADTVAIIVAGGVGLRFGDPHGKQFVELAGRPIIAWSLIAFDAAPSVASIVIVCAPDRADEMRDIISDLALSKPVIFADAGEVRQESVASGLAAMPRGYAYVAIHDAARPLIETSTIERAIAVLRSDPALAGTLVSARVTDTLKLVEDGIVVSTPDRSFYWAAQTPQTFRTRVLEDAYANAAFEDFIGTDDASLVERAGGIVRCVEPASPNIKVTFPEDLAVAETLLSVRCDRGEALV